MTQEEMEGKYKAAMLYCYIYPNEDFSRTIPILKELAALGYVKAQWQLALMYKYGLGFRKDRFRALYWFLKTITRALKDKYCKQKNQDYSTGVELIASTCYKIGDIHHRARGWNPQNYHKAIRYYTLAANLGHVRAQYCLGKLYGLYFDSIYDFKGLDLKPDREKSFYWFREAAKQGHAKAQFFLGSEYLHKSEFSQKRANRRLAKYYFTLAAQQGHRMAKRELKQWFNIDIAKESNND